MLLDNSNLASCHTNPDSLASSSAKIMGSRSVPANGIVPGGRHGSVRTPGRKGTNKTKEAECEFFAGEGRQESLGGSLKKRSSQQQAKSAFMRKGGVGVCSPNEAFAGSHVVHLSKATNIFLPPSLSPHLLRLFLPLGVCECLRKAVRRLTYPGMTEGRKNPSGGKKAKMMRTNQNSPAQEADNTQGRQRAKVLV